MKVAIIFHSVCGNTYLAAKAFEEALHSAGHHVILRRVEDLDWVEKSGIPHGVRQVLTSMRAVPVAQNTDLSGVDLILMGSPVYFGNVSAELKAFIDSTGGLWFQGALAGKKFAAFVSAGHAEGGGDLALMALHTYAKYMGMLSVPLPLTVLAGENGNPLGIIQYSDGKPAVALDPRTSKLIDRWSRFF